MESDAAMKSAGATGVCGKMAATQARSEAKAGWEVEETREGSTAPRT